MRERAASSKSDKGNDSLRITDQFRTRHGMAYELRERGSRLTLLIAERATPEAGTEWLVEATSTQFPGAAFANAAATRAEALRRTGVNWAADCDARGLPSFDWEAVAKALTAVRAI